MSLHLALMMVDKKGFQNGLALQRGKNYNRATRIPSSRHQHTRKQNDVDNKYNVRVEPVNKQMRPCRNKVKAARVVSSRRNGSEAQAVKDAEPVQFRPSGAALGQWVSPTCTEAPERGHAVEGGGLGGKALVSVLPVARPGCSDGTVA